MTTAFILITAILILGGVIATVGDRIGTRVGKKRLSLFNLRPKRTAVLVTILTGIGISASTLASLFLVDEGLRKGVFELEDIQRDLRLKREQLEGTTSNLEITKNELEQARKQQAQAEQDLQIINRSLQAANTKQRQTQAQLNETLKQQARTQALLQGTQSKLNQVAIRYKKAIEELQSIIDERNNQIKEIKQLRAERRRLYLEAKLALEQAETAINKRDRELDKRQEAIEKRDQKIAQLDKQIQERNSEIASREKMIAQRQIVINEKQARLSDLERQQASLEQQLTKLGQSNRDLRLGKLALVRGQVIAEAVVSVEKPDAAEQAVIKLLQEANRSAVQQLSEPGSNSGKNDQQSILFATAKQIQQLSKQIDDGREYVVRIFSAGNYVRGEKRIEFFADAATNEIVFQRGEVLATTTADPQTMTPDQVRQRLELLISASQFRARNAGILENIQIEGTFIRFVALLRQYNQSLDIKAVAAQDTYRAGPLKVKLVAILNGQIIFST
ncbi:DUF3084 domain-containing protein [Plectonema cf. radiosum LEGE 06105]|uniref:DUF3084 domain-containing protein n=1 Tax=Plectonema cf. radiosum LEGE 06105 TaxID=945769 RepID=A0A8J7F7N8_9CYAN|nr:DUF3084 domain-containing protein [Plectonema radiosum]MBE9213564.1 DUF3084 domain-containing protein [Plectonema cf. radiosum LEGE 06105]